MSTHEEALSYAKEIIRPYSKLFTGTRFTIDEFIQDIATAILDAEKRERERCAKLCETIPTDKKRCAILLLTEQAWEEGQYACAEAIRKGE